tara:strand:+ start:645 stop:956 length:312 start_codon:yes stop_codon:yes gene_type:complete
MKKVLLLITTAPNRLIAKNIAELVVKRKLAACVSIKEVISFYEWKGRIEQGEEIEITIKSTPENLNELTKVLKEKITYELPQLIYKLFDSEIKYFNWVKESVN